MPDIHPNELHQLNVSFRHAEQIGQSRLNNFLMTGTVLLVGCAVALQLDMHVIGGSLSAALSVLGIVFSRAWFYLGCRQQKFHTYIEDCIDLNCSKNSVDGEYLVTELIRCFQRSDLPIENYRVNQLERDFSSRRMLTYVPRYFAYAYIGTFVLSVLNMFQCSGIDKATFIFAPVFFIIFFLLLYRLLPNMQVRRSMFEFLFARKHDFDKMFSPEDKDILNNFIAEKRDIKGIENPP